MRKTIVISVARSGTNYALNVIDKLLDKPLMLKEIFRDAGDNHEILNKLVNYDGLSKQDKGLKLWQNIAEVAEQHEYTDLVAKIFYYHRAQDTELWNSFNDDHTIIHLIRGNIFNMFVSLKLAELTDQWQLKNDEDRKSIDSLVIDRAELLAFIEEMKKLICKVRSEKSNLDNYHEIYYEDIASSVSDCMERLAKIYHIEDFEVRDVEQRRQKVLSNEELIENYSEVSDLDRILI